MHVWKFFFLLEEEKIKWLVQYMGQAFHAANNNE